MPCVAARGCLTDHVRSLTPSLYYSLSLSLSLSLSRLSLSISQTLFPHSHLDEAAKRLLALRIVLVSELELVLKLGAVLLVRFASSHVAPFVGVPAVASVLALRYGPGKLLLCRHNL